MRQILRALLLLALIALGSSSAFAAKTTAACWFSAGWLYAEGLPTTYPYSVTSEPYPTGTTQWSADGTLAVQTWATDAFIWVRGHGPSLIKAGPALNDYHVIAMCSA